MKRLQKDQNQGMLSTSGGVPGTLGMSLNDNVLGRGQQVSGLVGPYNKDNIMRKNKNKKSEQAISIGLYLRHSPKAVYMYKHVISTTL